jgi:hypothetical protein
MNFRNASLLTSLPALLVLLLLLFQGSGRSAPRDASDLTPYSPLIELRQYRLYPGKRDVLIELFEREFIESQESVGMQVIGQFRDAEDANRFVWVRGFRNMDERAKGLNAFYFGSVWQRFRGEANATLEDNDNVLLLHEARAGSGFAPVPIGSRPPAGANGPHPGVVIGTIYYLKDESAEEFASYFHEHVSPYLIRAGTTIIATYESEHAPNNFPRLPVREGETVFVCFSTYPSFEAHEAALRRLEGLAGWQGAALAARLARPPEVLKLLPTARSTVPH